MSGESGGEIDPRNEVTYMLKPGFLYFCKGQSVVHSVLGSCVAVCLWDTKTKYGGVNHFLYPATNNKSQATVKYGNVATLALVQIMEDAGCRRKDIVAQIFGGGYPEGESGDNVGKKNVEVARKVLERKKIKIVSEDTGGTMGRKIAFDIGTGNVAVLKVQSLRESDWYHDGPK